MSDNKTYYYMRVKEDFYESDEMKILQSMDNGYLYSDILMKLYLKSLKNGGRLMFKDSIPYNPKMISTITGHNIDTVEKALRIFRELGLIEVLDNGAIYMIDIQNFIGKTSTESDRKREYRKRIAAEKNKLLEGGQMSGQMSGQNDLEIDIKKDIDIDIDIDIKKDIDKKETKKKKETKHKHGEYKHVMLTDEQYTKLINELSTSLAEECITYLDEYIEMKGYKANNHYLCIKKWVIDAVNRKNRSSYPNNNKGGENKYGKYDKLGINNEQDKGESITTEELDRQIEEAGLI